MGSTSYHEQDMIPIYIDAELIKHESLEAFQKLLETIFREQYDCKSDETISGFDDERIAIIIDGLENSSVPIDRVSSLIEKINFKYKTIFIFSRNDIRFDELFASNPRLYSAINEYKKFAILQFGHELRYQLINKWKKGGELQQ